MPVPNWSTTPASNNAAPPFGFPEGQAPSTFNDGLRQMMADIVVESQKNQVKVLGSVGGTANAITAAMTPTLTAYSAGMIVVLVPAASNSGATTLSVDGLGALPVYKRRGATISPLAENDLQANVAALAMMSSTLGSWLLINPAPLVPGSGNGLDADTVDGLHASAFAAAAHNQDASTITSGTFDNARIAASNVTQHQASLTIATGQLSGTLANGTVAQSNVTQHAPAVLASAALTGVPTAPTQGVGNNTTAVATTAFVMSQSLGNEQSWSGDLAGSTRVLNTNYTNSTGRAIQIIATGAATNTTWQWLVDGVSICFVSWGASVFSHSMSVIVPPGATYQLNVVSGSGTLQKWQELA